jgi:hypothetical protein
MTQDTGVMCIYTLLYQTFVGLPSATNGLREAKNRRAATFMQCVSSVGIDLGTLGSIKRDIPHGDWRCNFNPSPTDVSPNDYYWTMRPLDDVSLERCIPIPTIPYLGGGREWGSCQYLLWLSTVSMPSRAGTHRSGALRPRDEKIQGTHLQGRMFWDTLI